MFIKPSLCGLQIGLINAILHDKFFQTLIQSNAFRVYIINIGINVRFYTYIYNKRNCNPPTLKYNNTTILYMLELKIPGIIFDHKFNFKQHCLQLRQNLTKRLNIIKFLSSKKYGIHSNTLLYVTKALILSKIGYGLQIYGHCPKSYLRYINSPYHSAIRYAL